MKPKTSPTSPKYDLEQNATLAAVWKEPTIQTPARIPLFVLAMWSLVFALVAIVALFGGLVWYLRQFPDSRLKEYLPATVTTVIQDATGTSSLEPPTAVKRFTDTTVTLLVAPAKGGVTTEAQITGSAIALSSNGWIATLNTALPNGVTVTATTSDRRTLPLKKTINDPAVPLVYAQTEAANLSPADFAVPAQLKAGQSIWIIVRRLTSSIAIHRQLIPAVATWQSCDAPAAEWTLDEPVTAPIGSAVVTDGGQVIGLLGSTGLIWSVDTITPILKSLFNQGAVTRAACGFTAISTQSLASASILTSGMLVGAANGGVAVEPNGPAAKAGLQPGDIIVSVDGNPLDDWAAVIREARPGQSLQLGIERRGVPSKVTLVLGVKKP